MNKPSVEGDANTDDDKLSRADLLGRNILALMEAHRARTAVTGAASSDLPSSPAVPGAASPELPPAPAVVGTASPQLPPSPAVSDAASPRLPPWLAVAGAASPQLPPSAPKETPPTEGPPAPVGARRTDLSDPVSPDAPPRMPMGIGGPNIEFQSRLEPRQRGGEMSVSGALSQPSSESDVVPKPSVPLRGGASRVGGLVLLFLIAGISALGLVLITSRDWTALVSPSDEPATTEVVGAPTAGKQPEQLAAIPRLIVEDRRANVNEPPPLSLSLDGDVSVSPDRPPVQALPETLKLQPDEIAVLLQRGKDMLKLGDVSAARLLLRRAAEADNAEAALLLASTFDPIELRTLGVMGFAPDLSQALSWYLKASALGSGEAQRRIERLGPNR